MNIYIIIGLILITPALLFFLIYFLETVWKRVKSFMAACTHERIATIIVWALILGLILLLFGIGADL